MKYLPLAIISSLSGSALLTMIAWCLGLEFERSPWWGLVIVLASIWSIHCHAEVARYAEEATNKKKLNIENLHKNDQ